MVNIIYPIVGVRGEGKAYPWFTQIKMCDRETCPLKLCTYAERGKCKFDLIYLTTVYSQYVDEKDGVGDILTEYQYFRLGNFLYIFLCYNICVFFPKLDSPGNSIDVR